MGLTYELRWQIRWARDRQARERLRRERLIARELAGVRWSERVRQAENRERREQAWQRALPDLLSEWFAREAA